MVNLDSQFPMCLPRYFPPHCVLRSYNTTLRSLIPLPDPFAPPNSTTHPSSYEEYAVGSIVMGLYPDTSCFYRAEVVAAPRDSQPGSRVCLRHVMLIISDDMFYLDGSLSKK